MDFYIYAYLDTRKPGNYVYGDASFEFEPIYIGKGKTDRMYVHLRKAKALLHRNGESKSIFVRKLKSMLSEGTEPTIIKVHDNLDESISFDYEKNLIKQIGRIADGTGTLTNIAEGGAGGKTWIGDHPIKGKTLEEAYGKEVADKMKANFVKMGKAKKGTTKVISEYHRQRLRETSYKKLNAGKLGPIPEDVKDKIRKTNQKMVRYPEWKVIVIDLVENGYFTTIAGYKEYVRAHPELKIPTRPEERYTREGWEGFKIIFKTHAKTDN